ncbi:MAG: hypothetical protein GXO63_01635 [Candidatus Micrarchaeota archaeon]|nr:hypothetical protein [Candidatus Micrarchaeota archaeon]
MKVGFDVLDKKSELPERSSLLLISPPIPLKNIFYLRFLSLGTVQDEGCILVTTDRRPDEIFEIAEKNSIKLERDRLAIVDCVSWSLKERKGDFFYVPGPAALNEISVAIERAREEIFKPGKPMRMVFDSVSTLLLYNNPNTIFRFLQVISNRAKASGTTAVFVLEAGMHDQTVVSTLEHLTDGTIEISDGKIRYRRFAETGWVKI